MAETSDTTTKPCRECPFSKKTMPGWLGSYTHTDQLHALVANEDRMPCHLPIDYETGADELAVQEHMGATCIGFLAYSRNVAKRFIDRRLRTEAEAVGKRLDVFASPMAMEKFHADRRPPSQVTVCDRCSDRMDDDEVGKCPVCERDGLCPDCVMDHGCDPDAIQSAWSKE